MKRTDKLEPSLPEENIDKCSGCGVCFYDCPLECIGQDRDGRPIFDLQKCTGCGKCSESCPGKSKLIVMVVIREVN
jgi:Pyruvate/2-oxoacid:ferredoxin oxidoreductase delta subunit